MLKTYMECDTAYSEAKTLELGSFGSNPGSALLWDLEQVTPTSVPQFLIHEMKI